MISTNQKPGTGSRDHSRQISGQYEDPTMILSKSRVTIGLLGLVILTLSTMMIFVILSVRIQEKGGAEQPLYVYSKSFSNITLR